MASTLMQVAVEVLTKGVPAVERDLAGVEARAQRTEKSFSSSMRSMGASMTSAGKSMTTFATVPLVAAGAGMVKLAADAEETGNKFKVVFGKDAQAMNRWITDLKKIMPATRAEIQEMTASMQLMLEGMGIAPKVAQGMSKDLVTLSGDLASFNNIPVAEAQEAITSALRGEYDALQKFVPAVSAAKVEQQAMKMGLGDTTSEISAQDKALAIYELTMNSTKDAQGDMARTTGSTTNSFRFLWVEIREAATAFGQDLLPVITPVVQRLIDLVGVFGDLGPRQRAVILGVGAFAAVVGPLLMVIGAMASGIGALAAAYTRLRNSQLLATIATKAWSIAAKVAAVSARVLGVALRFMLGPWGLLIAAVVLGATLIYRNWGPIKKFFINLWNTIKRVAMQAATAIKNYVVREFNDTKRDVMAVWNAISRAISAAWNFIKRVTSAVWNAIKSFLGAAWNWLKGQITTSFNFYKTLVTSVWNAIKSVTTAVWNAVKTFVGNRLDEMKRMIETFKQVALRVFNSLPGPVRDIFKAIGKAMTDPVETAKDVLRGIWNTIVDGINKVLDYLKIDTQIPRWEEGANVMAVPAGASPRALYTGGLIGPGERVIVGDRGQREYVINPARRDNAPLLSSAAHEMGFSLARGRARRDEGERHHRHSRAENRERMRQMRSRSSFARQEGFGPTMYTWIPAMQSLVNQVKGRFNVSANTYSNHPPGFRQPFYRERSADFWGPAGRGSPIGSIWPDVASYAGQIAGGATNWILNPANDPAGHWDHVHITAFAGGGGGITSAFLEALWERLVQGPYERATEPLASGMVLRQAVKAGGQKVLDAVKEWVLPEPRLALGGLVTSPTVGLMGEAGRELVLPLQNPAARAAIQSTMGFERITEELAEIRAKLDDVNLGERTNRRQIEIAREGTFGALGSTRGREAIARQVERKGTNNRISGTW